MFFIYGSKTVTENDSWSGELECPHCGRKTNHIFKLRNKYPTFFFITIPLPRTLKRYLICTSCGANREVKKAEYKTITAPIVSAIEQ